MRYYKTTVFYYFRPQIATQKNTWIFTLSHSNTLYSHSEAVWTYYGKVPYIAEKREQLMADGKRLYNNYRYANEMIFLLGSGVSIRNIWIYYSSYNYVLHYWTLISDGIQILHYSKLFFFFLIFAFVMWGQLLQHCSKPGLFDLNQIGLCQIILKKILFHIILKKAMFNLYGNYFK